MTDGGVDGGADSDPDGSSGGEADGPPPGRLVLVTGAQAAGKTTVGRALASRLPRALHVDGDDVAAMVVTGTVPMTLPPPPAAVEQLFLRWIASLAVAETYQRAGFDAVVTDNVFGELLDDFLDLVAPAPLHLVVLHPSADALRAREAARAKTGYSETVTVEALHTAVATGTRRVGLWLDTTELTVDETVDAVLARLDEALLGPGPTAR